MRRILFLLILFASVATVHATGLNNPPAPPSYCGTTSTCGNTPEGNTHIVYGSAPLVSGVPSAVTISGISPAFTSSTSYVCTADDSTAVNALQVANVSGSSFTITGPSSVSDVVRYSCIGN